MPDIGERREAALEALRRRRPPAAEVPRRKRAGSGPPHGTESRYINNGCRCDACREAHAAGERRRYDARRAKQLGVTVEELQARRRERNRRPGTVHGTESRYVYGCRCDACREAKRLAERRRRENRRAKSLKE